MLLAIHQSNPLREQRLPWTISNPVTKSCRAEFFFFFLYSFCSPLLCSLGLFKVLSHFTIDQILNLNSFDTHGNANGDGSGTIGLLQFIGKVENIQYLRKALYAKIVSILIWTRFPSCDLICLVDRSPRIICSDTKSMYVSWEQSNTNIIAL